MPANFDDLKLASEERNFHGHCLFSLAVHSPRNAGLLSISRPQSDVCKLKHNEEEKDLNLTELFETEG
jgi:hypothetical protein